jgi:hypothetical protein
VAAPTAKSVDEELGELTREVRELGRRMDSGFGDLRTDLAGFRGEVKNDLRWIKGIGAALLAGSGWVIWNAATATSEIRYQGARLEKLEKRQEASAENIQKQLETLIRRTEPKAGG